MDNSFTSCRVQALVVCKLGFRECGAETQLADDSQDSFETSAMPRIALLPGLGDDPGERRQDLFDIPRAGGN